MSSITAQTTSLSTPVRSIPTPREASLNINNKNLNGRPGNSRNPVVSPQPVGHSQRSVLSTGPVMTVRSHQKIRVTVLCARSLAKRDLFRLPDPFVRVHVDGSGKRTFSNDVTQVDELSILWSSTPLVTPYLL